MALTIPRLKIEKPFSQRGEIKEKPIYAVAAAVRLPYVNDFEFESSLSELQELAKALGFSVIRTFIQNRGSFDTTGYLGVDIHYFVKHEAECEIEAILVNHEISPSQARNLEKETGCGVMDRTMVISDHLPQQRPFALAGEQQLSG